MRHPAPASGGPERPRLDPRLRPAASAEPRLCHRQRAGADRYADAGDLAGDADQRLKSSVPFAPGGRNAPPHRWAVSLQLRGRSGLARRSPPGGHNGSQAMTLTAAAMGSRVSRAWRAIGSGTRRERLSPPNRPFEPPIQVHDSIYEQSPAGRGGPNGAFTRAGWALAVCSDAMIHGVVSVKPGLPQMG